MKVKIEYTQEVSDDFRRAINNYYGNAGMASREEVKQWFWLFGQSMDDEIMSQLSDDEG